MANTILFSRSLYAVDAVQAAAEVYAALARVEVVVRAQEIEVCVTELDDKLEANLLDELANHALFETVIRQRASDGGGHAAAS